ncbi:MAG: hypothetical protein UZ22_OP11002000712 [Microgenomates bacterium OLB23]|nr:MAG: hypothetical protein UZ22_OP11002000712 [Microgenomates bacterium OLB23]
MASKFAWENSNRRRKSKYKNSRPKRLDKKKKKLLPIELQPHNFCVEISIQNAKPCKSFDKCLENKQLAYKDNPYCYNP